LKEETLIHARTHSWLLRGEVGVSFFLFVARFPSLCFS